VVRFRAIHPDFNKLARSHGWAHGTGDAETFNQSGYFCPVCGATDRERFYALFLEKKLRENRNASVRLLEIAPTDAMGGFFLRHPEVKRRTCDLFMKEVDDCVDITDMHGYADGAFDAFLCSHVLEHVPDDHKAMSELLRVLVPGGWGIVMVPICTKDEAFDEAPDLEDVAERCRRFGQPDHIRLYTRRVFRERLDAAGFSIHEYRPQDFGADTAQRCGITERSILYVVEKTGEKTL